MKRENKPHKFKIRCINVSEDLPDSDKPSKQKNQIVHFGNADNYSDKLEFCKSLLSAGEIERMNKFVFDDDRLTYCISHGFLRILLSEITSIPEHKVEFDYMRDTKPCLLNSGIDFNISHSKNYFSVAVSEIAGTSIGVDLEKVNNLKDYKSIIRNYMHTDEETYIFGNILSEEEQLFRFYEIWTRKEAFLKMLGTGITENLQELNVSPGKRTISSEIPENFSSGSIETNIYTKSTSDFVLSVSKSLNYIPEFIEINF
jgi:4'-phosphopantetheinyl transferase